MKKYFSLLIISALACMLVVTTLVSNISANSPDQDYSEGVSLENLIYISYAQGECNLCVIENRKDEIVFSCEPNPAEECEKSHALGSVYCDNALECELEWLIIMDWSPQHLISWGDLIYVDYFVVK